MIARSVVGALIVAVLTWSAASADELTLTVPAIDASVVVQEVGVTDGVLDAPSDADQAGAVQLSGNLLVVGHRDWQGRRRPFSRLPELQQGDVVELSDGRVYSVSDVTVWDVDGDQDPWTVASAPTQADVLTLLSCTGPFSVGRHEYLQRIAVRAERTNYDD